MNRGKHERRLLTMFVNNLVTMRKKIPGGPHFPLEVPLTPRVAALHNGPEMRRNES